MSRPSRAEIHHRMGGAGDGDPGAHRPYNLSHYRPSLPTLILCMLLILLAGAAFVAPLHRFGDASTYYMQTASIARDFDIQYLPVDLHRALEKPVDDIPAGLFLTKTEDGRYFYSKEFSYAASAAPFFRLLGNNGILVFNAVLFWAMILMGYLYLRKKNENMVALITSVFFFTLSAAFLYIFWIHPEIYNMFLITAGLFVWLLYYENKDYRYLLVTSVIFGIATIAKLPNILLFLPIIAFELFNRRGKNILSMILLFSVPLLIFYGYFFLSTGYQSFYGGERLIFVGNYPFLDGYNNSGIDTGIPTFSTGENGRISQLVEQVPSVLSTDALKQLSYNVWYYFSGRFTGMIWYYPFTLFALFSIGFVFRGLLKEPQKGRYIHSQIKMNQERFIILAGICLYIAAFLFFSGNNYFGGNHAVGNRYFAVYPAFLFLIGYIDLKKILAFTVIAGVILVPVVADPLGNSQNPYNITTHTPFKYLPIEYTQMYNLPLWNNRILVSSDYRWYMVRGYADNQNRAHLTSGFSEYVVVSGTEREFLQVMLHSETDNNSILVRSGDASESVVLNSGDTDLLQISGIRPEYSDNRYYLYRLSVSADDEIWLQPIDFNEESDLSFNYFNGWHALENWNGVLSRWMSNNATLLVFSPDTRNATLDLNSVSFFRVRNLEIFNNNVNVKTEVVPAWSFVQITANLTLNPGENEIRFFVPEGCERPVDIPGSTNRDGRCLSLGMQKIAIISERR